MSGIQIENQKVFKLNDVAPPKPVTGRELEQLVGVGLLEDLNGQLADISSKMEFQLKERQSLRAEIEEIHRIKIDREPQNIDGQSYRDLSPAEAYLLGVSQNATPQTDETGAVLGYRLKEDMFREATEAALEGRDKKLSELNSNGEMTMLQIQSLVDQRKNALTLMSNLLAASNEVAKTIIGNIRG